MPDPHRTGPDFMIIGAMKAGTSTLHEQLAAQAGVFMSTPKEPNFFSDDDQFARGTGWYDALFESATPEMLRGESSTHYTKLPERPATIERLRSHPCAARCKLVYVMRDPMSRLVSHYMHAWSEGETVDPLTDAIDTVPGLIDYGRYAMQIAPWLEAFGRERVLPVFFERMTAEPQSEIERIAAFLGVPSPVSWHDLGAKNQSAQRMRRSPVRDAILNAPVLKQIRRGLIPRSWRDRAKGMWQMRERPTLTDRDRARLAEVFNADLADLGRALGVALTCDTWRDVAMRGPHTFVPRAAGGAA